MGILHIGGEVTNDMFATVTRENIMRNGTPATTSAITKAFKDQHLFAVNEDSDIFRY